MNIRTVAIGEKEKENIVFDTLKEMKLKNEMLNTSTYNQFWKQTPSSQRRLLSAFDSEKGKMHFVFLQAHIS